MQLSRGTLLQNSKFRIIEVLGQGGFGITYLAENLLLGRKVAIKEFFPKEYCGRDATSHLTLGTQNNADTVARLKERFIKEAKNIAKLNHPGIVRIHDIFEENHTAYYVMDYIDGENLNEMVRREGPLSEAQATNYAAKVGRALQYIHSNNMTHFDVKPANIVVRRADNEPILIDFGLSKQYDAYGSATSTLIQGVSQGFSPIELYNPGTLNTFSPQTDIYSLGATLLFLLTGKTPPSPYVIYEEGLSIPSTISPTTAGAIRSAMTYARKDRPATLTSWLASLPAAVAPTPTEQCVDLDLNDLDLDDDLDDNTILIDPRPKKPEKPEKDSGKTAAFIFFGIFAFILIAAFALRNKVNDSTPNTTVNDSTPNTTTEQVEQVFESDSYFETINGVNKWVGVYIGAFNDNNEPHGEGNVDYFIDDPYERQSFSGTFEHGKRVQGILSYKDGTYYKGSFKTDGGFNTGTTHNPNGTIIKNWRNGDSY